MWQNFVIKQNIKKHFCLHAAPPFQGCPEATASIASRSCATDSHTMPYSTTGGNFFNALVKQHSKIHARPHPVWPQIGVRWAKFALSANMWPCLRTVAIRWFPFTIHTGTYTWCLHKPATYHIGVSLPVCLGLIEIGQVSSALFFLIKRGPGVRCSRPECVDICT